MTEDELKTIIRQVLIELVSPKPRRALVLFTGGLIGFEDAIEGLRLLQAAGVHLDCAQTPSARRILDQDLIASLGMPDVTKNLVTAHDMIIAPTLTANISAKVAHGVSDCLASNVLAEFIMSNRPVVVSKTPIDPDGDGKRQWYPEIPAGYAAMLRANLDTLSSFGIRVVRSTALCRAAIAAFDERDRRQREPLLTALGGSAAELAATAAPARAIAPAQVSTISSTSTVDLPTQSALVVCDQHLISQQLVQKLPIGTDLRISPNAVVTALARDIASARSIRISRKD